MNDNQFGLERPYLPLHDINKALAPGNANVQHVNAGKIVFALEIFYLRFSKKLRYGLPHFPVSQNANIAKIRLLVPRFLHSDTIPKTSGFINELFESSANSLCRFSVLVGVTRVLYARAFSTVLILTSG